MCHKPVISVIVPVYQVEPYLRLCVDSILAQTFVDFELILVDDGSSDGSGAICDAYAAEDDRVVVIHQHHQGVSSARNTGLDWACANSGSEWIAYIDSDDAVAGTYLEHLYQYATAYDADIATVGAADFSEDTVLDAPDTDDAMQVQVADGIRVCKDLYRHREWVSVCSWGKLIRKSLLQEKRFPEGKIYEDQYLIPQILYRAGRIVTLHTRLYYYRYRADSITHRPFSLRRFEDVEGFDTCIAFYESCGDRVLAELAEEQKKCSQAQCVILAWRHHKQKEIPRKYRMPLWKAVIIAVKYNLKRGGLRGAWEKMCKVLR